MPDKYEPPFTMTEEMMNSVIEIGELVGKISSHESLSMNPKLRRESRIKSIHSSLAIENNTLTLEQTTAVIEGKRVLAPPQDIREVQNAYEAYEHCLEYDPYSIDDLLTAHKYMMNDLVKEAGMFRTKNVGVYSGDVLIHAGTPANYVAELMQQLFVWLRESKLHPLVKSCIFHYEFEFIHPFNDGNGRTGRLWQSLILQKWQPLFAWLPVETMIHDNQQSYYDAIGLSNKEGSSDKFVEFMLGIIKSTLEELVENQSGQDVGINVGINVGIKTADKVLSLLEQEPKLSAAKIAEILGITSRQAERILADLKSSGKIERVGSNKSGYWKINMER